MLFHSVSFWVFFAVVALLFGIIPQRYRWYLLLAASLFFFIWALPIGLIYLLLIVLIVYLCSIQIEKLCLFDGTAAETKIADRKRRMLLAVELIAAFGVLIVLKYSNFILGLIPGSDHVLSLPVRFAVPLALSFYTFQLTGYAIDVYHGIILAQKNPAKLLLFSAYFPQMIEGPISRYKDISESLYYPSDITYERGKKSLMLFAWGLFKKVCIADSLSVYTDYLFQNYQSFSGLMILSAGIVYVVFLYADFSGCIDMARAVSGYLGVDLKDNFQQPFFSRSVKEYWRRWHITLGSWFRDYVYIPLGGNRKGLPIQLCNLLIVWLLTGIWHGANWTYIVFGLFHGTIMIISLLVQKLRPYKRESTHPTLKKWLEIARTFLLVSISFLFFRAPSVSVAWNMIKQMFDFRHFFVLKQASLAYHTFLSGIGGTTYLIITGAGILLLFYHDVMSEYKKPAFRFIARSPKAIKYCLAVLTVMFLLFMVNRSAGNFVYMQF